MNLNYKDDSFSLQNENIVFNDKVLPLDIELMERAKKANVKLLLPVETVVSKEFKIYEYAELSQKAKERVRNNYIENLDADIFTEQIMEDLREKGLENLRPLYSLSCCQGDGLCLYGSIEFKEIIVDYEKVSFCIYNASVACIV